MLAVKKLKTHALQWRLERQRQKMARVRAKRETKRVLDFALKAVYQGTGKGKWSFGKGGTRKVAKVAKVDGRTHDRKAVARKEANGKRKVEGRNQKMLDVWQDKTHCSLVQTTKKICKHGVCWKIVK